MAKLRVDKVVEGNAVWHEHGVEDISGLTNPILFKGTISVNSDFPTSTDVQNGWFYIIDTDVTDDDPTKTNTGQAFLEGDEIVWNGTNWTTVGSNLTGYALLDGSNQPFTGDLAIEKTTPRFVVEDTGGTSKTLVMEANNTDNASYLKATTGVPARAPIAVNLDNVKIQTPGNPSELDFDIDTPFSLDFWLTATTVYAFAYYPFIVKGASASSGWSISLYSNNSSNTLGLDCRLQNDASNYIRTVSGTIITASVGTYTKHITVTYNGSGLASGLNVYVNGALATTNDYNVGTLSSISNSNALYIDGITTQNTNPLLDELVIWNKELTPSEVIDRYNSGSGSYVESGTANVVGVWHFDNSLSDSENSNDFSEVTGTVSYASGTVAAPPLDSEVNIIKVSDGSTGGANGTIELGNDTSDTILNGGDISLQIGGVEYFNLSDSAVLETSNAHISIKSDSNLLYFGAAVDASIGYNGTNLVINPKEIGSGRLSILGSITDLEELNFMADAGGGAYKGDIAVNDTATSGFTLYETYTDVIGELKHADNLKIYFGTGDNSSITYDGTNMLINPKEVGSGYVEIDNKIKFKGTGLGNAGTISWGTGYGNAAAILYESGATGSYGWGLQASEMQFFIPATKHFSWNFGGALQPSGTNEIMRLEASGNLQMDGTINVGSSATINGGITLTPTGGANRTIDFGAGSGQPALILYNGVGTADYGWGLQPNNMQFFLPDTKYVSFNGGGALQTPGTLEWASFSSTYFKLPNDNQKLYFGAGDDASITYDGTNLVVNPKEVGSGYLQVSGQILATDKIMFTQTDGNEYIDSLADGTLDASATISIGLAIGGTQQIILTDGNLAPTTDSDIDLGDTTHYFKDAYIDSIITTGNVVVGGDLEINQHATFDAEYDNGNSSTAKTIDWGVGNYQKITLTGNCTLTFTAPDGVGKFQLKVIQDGTGSRTLTYPATVKWSGGTAPTLTTTATTGTDILVFYYDGTSYYGGSILDFS